MTEILVTGGAGFIGSHLCKALLKQKYDVFCVDNMYTGHKRNILPLMDNQSFQFLRHDITQPLFVEIEQIYNLACPASPIHYQIDPVQTLKTCVHGSMNMLDLALRKKAKIFQASTSEVYGDPQEHPQTENYQGRVNIIGPRSCYDEGKRCAETLFFDYNRTKELQICVARIFNTYGPNMLVNDGRVISNFIVQALKGQDITIYGDGMQTRSFCYVDDMVDGIIKLMSSDIPVQPYNIGNPHEITILELAHTIADLLGVKIKLKHGSIQVDDPRRRCPDISRISSMIGWQPQTKLQDGLLKTINYFEKLLSNNEH